MRLSERFETSELLDPIHQEIANLIAYSLQPIHEKIFDKFCDEVITDERWKQIQQNPFPFPYKSWEQIYSDNPNERNDKVIKLVETSLNHSKEQGLRNLLFILTALRFEQENVFQFWMPRSKRLRDFLEFPYNDDFAMSGNEASPVVFGKLSVLIGTGPEGMTANKPSYTPDVEMITEAEGRKWPEADRKAGVRSVIYYPLNDEQDQVNVGIACLCSPIPGLFGEANSSLGNQALNAFREICDASRLWIPVRSAARIVPHRQQEKINLLLSMMHLVPTQFRSTAIEVAAVTQSAISRLKECGRAYQDIETKAQHALQILHHGELISIALRLYYAKKAPNGTLDSLPLLDIHQLLCESLLPFQTLFKTHGVNIELQWSNQPYCVRGDKARLMTAFMLIIDNALDAMSVDEMKTVPNKQLTIRTFPVADSCQRNLRVEISDTGHGMEPKILESLKKSIKNRQQLENRRQHGTGMGMIIADEFLREHRGKLLLEHIRSVEHEEGKKDFGTTIPIELPLAEEQGDKL